MSKVKWLEVLKLNEDQLEDMRLAAYAYIRQGKYQIALNLFEGLGILDPENAYDAQTLGALYIQLNQPQKALVFLDRALKYDGDHTPTLINLCKALFMLGRKEDGLRLARILSKDPSPAIANVAKALLLAFK